MRERFPCALQFFFQPREQIHRAGQITRFAQVGGWDKVQVPAGEFDAIRLRVIMRLDDETFWRFATECNYEIWWSPAAGASVRESKIATYLDKGDSLNAIQHRSQNALLELTSFRRGS